MKIRYAFKLVGVFLAFFTALAIIAGFVVISFLPRPSIAAQDLEDKERVMNRLNTGIILLDRNGQEFARFYKGRHIEPTPIDQIPLDTKEAFISAEDRDFYNHNGYSPRAIAASVLANIRQKEQTYGGSTITQQLAKNSFLTQERSWARKYQELLLAQQLEDRYSKDDILEMYLNSVYFGEGAFGIGQASEKYFSKTPDQLNLAQSSLLAGLVNAPSTLSPLSGDLEGARDRQRYVLQQMLENGHITEEERQTAEKADLELNPSEETVAPLLAPHFAYMVRQELISRHGEEVVARSGFIVHTSLDLGWQKKAEEEVTKQVNALAKNQVSNGSVVVIDPKTSEVRALVGSKDWENTSYGKYNVATANRQPGSSFKPLVYLAGIEKGIITPTTILHDRPTTFGKNYRPENYDLRYRGDVTARRSLANSLNVTTVETQQKVGVPATLDLAKRLGITTLSNFSPNDLSLSLGSGEVPLVQMTNAYAALANGGNYAAPVLITKIIDKHGAEAFKNSRETQQTVKPEHAFLITSILSDNEARKEVFGSALTISRPAAVKTGTSQGYKDSWTIGYTPSLVIGVWVGNNDGRPMNKVAGSLGAAPIWKNLMESYLQGTPSEDFTPPSEVVQVNICKSRGLRVPDNFTGGGIAKEYFVKGTEPTRECSLPTPTPSTSPSPSETPSEILPIGGAPEPLPLPTVTPSTTPTPTITPSPTPTPSSTPTPYVFPTPYSPPPGNGNPGNSGHRD